MNSAILAGASGRARTMVITKFGLGFNQFVDLRSSIARVWVGGAEFCVQKDLLRAEVQRPRHFGCCKGHGGYMWWIGDEAARA